MKKELQETKKQRKVEYEMDIEKDNKDKDIE